MRPNVRILCATALYVFLISQAYGQEPKAAEIATKMAGVTDELNKNETGMPVQTEQKAIVRDLDALIASLEKKARGNGNGLKNNRPERGMDDSRISRGSGGIGTLLNPSDNGKDWGKLSGRERDRILQSMTEGFPPEYRTILERYYRRLADEKTSQPASAPAVDQPKPQAPAQDQSKAEMAKPKS